MPSPPDHQARRWRTSLRTGTVVLACLAVLALVAVELAARASAEPSPIGVICGLTPS